MADVSLILDGLGGIVKPSTAGNDLLLGTSKPETFYIGGSESGNDTIKGFGKNDLLVLDNKIYDSNDDGIIKFGANKLLDLNERNGSDTVKFVDPGLKGLRLIGSDADGHFAYADMSVRLAGFTEGTLADNTMSGTALKVDNFFFDLDLDVNWGNDTINNFGEEDFLVTTVKLFDSNNDGRVDFGGNKKLDLNGSDDLGHSGVTGAFGLVAINDTSGDAVTTLFLDHTMVKSGVTYYYYSLSASESIA